ncbi:MAG TPA: histidine kinase dimerization/phospho-acceptor domain-containing protein, partial [Syntrophomonadaceae bacterium]|nr:histidine kinase dimerization/phospho-acceptor domain-containing protein [Syntrophomonadaceae bacterium]
MSNARKFARVFKYVVKTAASIVFEILKLVLPLIPRLFREISKEISKRLRFSITFKTTVTYSLLFTIILLILGTLLTGAFGSFLIYNTNKSLEKNSRVVADLIDESTDIPRDKIKKFADLEMFSVILSDENASVVYTTAEGIPGGSFTNRTRLSSTSSLDTNLGYLYFETPVNLNNGIRKIEAAKNLSEEKIYLTGLVISTAIAFFLAIIIMIIIGARTSRRMLRPINTMTRTARSISAGELNTRLDVVDSHDELKELALTFNEMLDRIQTSFEKQEVFVSDASHELRTPISVIQGYANLLQRWGKEDRAVLQESIDAIKGESDYMKELVEKLLFLASADKKKQRLETAPFALNELAEEVLKETALIDSEHTI